MHSRRWREIESNESTLVCALPKAIYVRGNSAETLNRIRHGDFASMNLKVTFALLVKICTRNYTLVLK